MAYIHFNNNPVSRNVGDCSVRAISKALDIGWEAAYIMLMVNGYSMGDMRVCEIKSVNSSIW